MAMTKQDYERIAGAFASMSTYAMTEREKSQFIELADRMAARFSSAYPAFRPGMFIEACKLPKMKEDA